MKIKHISSNKPITYLLLFIKIIIVINSIYKSNTFNTKNSFLKKLNLLKTISINTVSNNQRYYSLIEMKKKKLNSSESQFQKFKNFLYNDYVTMKKNIQKNGSGIKKCGLDFLTEVYCQFYKKNYNENVKNCRKLKLPDFKKNCSNLKSLYVLFYVKSALNTFSIFKNEKKLKSEIHVREIYKKILSKLIKPFTSCSEIPNEIKHNMLKKQIRILYNKKQIKVLTSKKKEFYKNLLNEVKISISMLNSDLIALDPKEENFKCIGIISGAKTIVNNFTN